MKKKGLVLLNMGAPKDLEEVEVFLKNMFNDPHILPLPAPIRKMAALAIVKKRLESAKANYEKVGGKSPLLENTLKLVDKVKESIGDEIHVTYGMRYTPPFAKDVIRELHRHDVEEVLFFPLYPHFSSTTTQSILHEYITYLTEYMREIGYSPKADYIESFYSNPTFNNLIVETILENVKDPKEYELIFSAHSIPQKMVDQGDPYLDQVKEHFDILTQLLGDKFNSYHLAFQSRVGPVKWLEPSLEEKFKEIGEGKKVVVYPISFVLDNLETVGELQHDYQELTGKFKDYKVISCLNEKMAKVIEDIVRSRGW